MRRLLTIIALLAAPLALGQGTRLGSLKPGDIVFTPANDVVAPAVVQKDGFPVFLVPIAAPYTECQLRASITNFEPGFLLKANGVPVYNFIPLVYEALVGGKRQYRALGTTDLKAQWSTGAGRWEIVIGGTTIFYTGAKPWDAATAGDSNTGLAAWGTAGGVTYTVTHEPFVYHTCTTSKSAEDLVTPGTWGTGSGDPDPWVYLSNQDADPTNFASQFMLTKWDWNTSLTSQLNPEISAWSPGSHLVFQPGRGNLGADEWMQQNLDKLVWVYQLQTPNGVSAQQPNGSHIWTVIRPVEWRKSRITLPTQAP